MAVNTLPVPFQAVAVDEFAFNVLLPPLSVPVVSVTSPVNVCVKPTPKFKVPPAPLIVNGPPLTFPVKVATPPVLVIKTVPVVVNAPILWVAVPVIVTPPVPLAVPPLLTKFPFKVSKKVDIDNEEPLFTVSGAVALNTLAAFIVIVPVFAIITPPEVTNGVIHSTPAVLELAVLY